MKVNLIKQKQQSLCNWNSCNLKIIYIVQIRWSHQNFLSNSLIKTPITGTHLIPKIIYFWSCNSNFVKKYSHRILFFEIIFFDFFLNETRLSGRRTQVQNKLYQTHNFRFVDTRRSFFTFVDIRFWICSCWSMFKFITTHDAELDLLLSSLEQKIVQHQPQQMRRSSLEQYFAPISLSDEIWFWLAKESLVFHQTRSDSLAESYQIITDRLLDFQLLHEIKFNVILCKTHIAGSWKMALKRVVFISIFYVRSAKKGVSLSLKQFTT